MLEHLTTLGANLDQGNMCEETPRLKVIRMVLLLEREQFESLTEDQLEGKSGASSRGNLVLFCWFMGPK